ncbi:Type-2 restriction enzyme BsuMI component YdiS [Altererythrobacter insulae]|nr:Type-2 restriction enzyme BsuMI component YdiS [Altererythrobacter insulae]
MPDLTQIESDGTTVIGEDPPFPNFSVQTDIIKNAFTDQGWTIIDYQKDEANRFHYIEVSKSGKQDFFLIFIPSRFSYSSPRANLGEKRIQLYESNQEKRLDLLGEFGLSHCALLGLYIFEDTVLFGAWSPSHLKRGATNLWMNSELLSEGARTGFARQKNQTGEILAAFIPAMLPSYLLGMDILHEGFEYGEGDEADEETPDALPQNEVPADLPHNRIFYGAPGTGKSHNLNAELEAHFPNESFFERTTFYPDYTSGTFMGAYRPTPIYREAEGDFLEADKTSTARNLEPLIDYRFVPGPFLNLLSRALANPGHNYCLVIEEINRANASAVFADAFQLLDRDENGVGKFTVTLAPEAQDYLVSQGHVGPVRLPANMYIWATMNSADQGVLPLDSAFKRRWTMEYVGLDDGEGVVGDWDIKLAFLENPIKWNAFRKVINAHLSRQGITEDRLLGPFFMTKKELARDSAFENKLLQYLREDVVNSAPSKLFAGGSSTFGSLVKSYRAGENIFVPEISFGGD